MRATDVLQDRDHQRRAVQPPNMLAFLFPHQRTAHGDMEDFLVSIDVIKALTGENFFRALDTAAQAALEDQDT